MARYRKKPVVVEAMQWPEYDIIKNPIYEFLINGGADYVVIGDRLRLRTLEGNMEANPGDWIIKGVKGEFYPCKPDIFEAAYEPADPEETP